MSDPKPPSEPAMDEILATIRRIIAEDESGVAPASTGSAIVSGDIFELTEAIGADGSVRHIPPFGSVPRISGDAHVPPSPDGRIEPAPPSAFAAAEPAGRPEGQELGTGGVKDADELEPVISEAAAPRMTAPASAPHDAAITEEKLHLGGDRGLENLVREMLQPMLQRWLDENLRGLVEELVRAEGARLTGDAAAPRRATRARPKTKPD